MHIISLINLSTKFSDFLLPLKVILSNDSVFVDHLMRYLYHNLTDNQLLYNPEIRFTFFFKTTKKNQTLFVRISTRAPYVNKTSMISKHPL
jgi:hypothetical protein